MKLLLARHGETEWNRAGRIQGLSNQQLNAVGRRQAEELALRLKEAPLAAVYSSPLRRALETAELIAEHHKLPVITLDGLKEMDAGELDGLTYQETRERYPDFMATWTTNAMSAVMPGGESILQLQERAWQATSWLLTHHPNETVVAVSHNFTILSIISWALGLPLANFRKLRCDPASLTVLELGEDWSSLERLNDRCHLSP